MGDREPFELFIEDAPLALGKQDFTLLQRLAAPLIEVSGPDLIQTSALCWLKALLDVDYHPVPLLSALLDTVATGVYQAPQAEAALPEQGTQSASQLLETERAAVTLVDEKALEAIGQVLRVQQQILEMPCDNSEMLTGRIASVMTVAQRALLAQGKQSACEQLEAAAKRCHEQQSTQALVEIITGLITPGAADKGIVEDIVENNVGYRQY